MSEQEDRVAALCHDVWAKRMDYLFLFCGERRSDGSFMILPNYVEKWDRQRVTDYADLPEGEKFSDLVLAREYIIAVEEEEGHE